MDCNCITCGVTKICIPGVTISSHYKLPVYHWKIVDPEDPDRFTCSGMIIWCIKYEKSVKHNKKMWKGCVSLLFLSLLCFTSIPFALQSEDSILIDIYEGHWLIISNSSPLITHLWYYVQAYLLKTPVGSTTFLMQIGQQLSFPSMMEEAGLVCS